MQSHTERRLVTCLFVDIVGSTDATRQLGPERMQRLLDGAFAEMSATIAGHGGTIEKYVGDAIFALFGAPVAHVDDPVRALRAAEACLRWSAESRPADASFAVRIGVESGEALVDLDALDRRQRIAVGDCVNIAARLQQRADPGEILVGPSCRQAVGDAAELEPLGSVSLKGLGELDAWRFIRFAAGDSVQQIAFVGRDGELGRLQEAFELSSSGTATFALVIGPPGQGKSRLVGEAVRRWSASSAARLITARCRPGAEVGSNTPLRQLLSADLPDATPESVRERASAILGADEGAAVAATLCHGAGLAVDERLLAATRLEQRDLIADAWRRYLVVLAGDGQLLAWVDDLHWADPVLLRIIERITTDMQVPLLVLGTARPEFIGSAHLRPRPHWVQIELDPLDRDESALLAQMAGDGQTEVARAAGNPLFIIELARSRSEAHELPLTVQGAIEARLDELDALDRELLQRASVAGETFEVRDVALLGEREPAEVAGMLGRVSHLGFVVPVDTAYRFHHALVRDVAYGRLPIAQRMALHARHARDGIDPDDAEARAHHWWEAVKPSEAAWVWEDAAALASMRREAFDAHLAAGRRLAERNAYEESLDVYLRAVELADETADLARAEAALGDAYVRQGRGEESWEHRLRAIALFAQIGAQAPPELYADMLEIASWNWGYFKEVPDDADVVRLLDEGERAAREAGDDVSLARLLAERAAFTDELAATDEIERFVESTDAARFGDAAHRVAQIYFWNGEVARSLSLYQTVFDRLVPAGALINEPEALMWYALSALHAGELGRAEALADRLADEASRRTAHTRQHASGVRALQQFVRGDWDGVRTTARELRTLVDENPDTSFCLIGAAAAGYGATADILAGRPPPDGLDEFVARLIPGSTLIQRSSVMLPKVMANRDAALADGLRAYAPDLRLIDRQRTWDVCDLMPAIGLTMLRRWDDLPPVLARLDHFAQGGSRLAAGAAAAIREEEAAASGGPPASHAALRESGYAGVSDLLRFRP